MADGTIKTVLEISGEGSYRNKLKEIGQALKGVASEERVLNAEFGKGDASLGKLTQQHALLENKLKLQKERLEAVRQEYERVVQAEGKNSTTAKRLAIEYNNCQAQVKTTEGAIKELSGQIDKSSGAWNRMAGWIDKNEKKLNRIGTTISNVAGKINKALTAATTAVVGYSAKAFMDFEDQMAIVGTIADETEVSLAELGEQALAASDATGQAATEIAAATYQAISAGADTAHAVDLVEKAAKGAKAGLSDTTTVVDGLTTAMNAWKISYDQSETVLDKMITTQNVGKTTLGDLANNMGKVTAFAPQVGVSLEEILAATAALTKNGYSTESAMTALKNVMSAVIKPTSQAKEAAKAMGLEFDAAALRSKGLVGFLQDVMAKTKGDEEALASLFGSVEGLGGVMLLAGSAAGDFSDALGKIGNSAGALNAAFDKRTSSRAEQMAMALNRLKNAAITFGQTLAPYIDMAAGAIEKLTDKLGSMSEGEQKTLLQAALWTVGLTKFVQIGGKAVASAGSVSKAISGIGKAAAMIGKGGGFASILTGAGGVAAGAVAGIAAIGAAIYGVGYAMDQLKGRTQIKNAFGDLTVDTEKVDQIKDKAQEIRNALEGMYQQESEFEIKTNTFFDDYITWLTDGLSETEEQVQGYKERFEALVKAPMDAIETAYRTRKADLDEALASHMIDKETYDQLLSKLESETNDAKSKVQGLQEAYETFTEGAVAANTALNEDQIEYLQGLRDQIVGVTNDILEANSAALQAAELSNKRVMQGTGTGEDYAVAVEAKRVEYEVGHEQRTQVKEAVELELRTTLDETADAETRQEIQTQIDELNANYEAAEAEAEATLSQGINELTAAYLSQYPELLAQMQEITERTHLTESIYQAIAGDIGSGDMGELQALAKQMGKAFNPDQWIDNGVIDTAGIKGLFSSWADEFEAGTAEMVEDLDKGQLGEALTSLFAEIENGALDDVDFSDLGDALDAALTVIDLTDDGRTIGMDLTKGEAQGLREGEPEVEATVRANALAAVTAARETLGVHSPSTVFAEIGANLMAGLRNGIQNNRRMITAALNQVGTMLRNAGRQSVQGWINGVNAMRPALVGAYAQMAEAAVAAAKSRLQIASPSKVFARIGQYTAAGMIAGLNGQIGAVQAAMERTVNPPEARRRGGSGDGDGRGGVVNNYITYNVPYSGTYGPREARKMSQELARVESSRRRGRGQ